MKKGGTIDYLNDGSKELQYLKGKGLIGYRLGLTGFKLQEDVLVANLLIEPLNC
jgi:hypothetical protein